MDSQRYYEGKTFLKALADAHLCMKNSIREKSKLEFKVKQTNLIYDELKNQNIKFENGKLISTDKYKDSKQFKFNNYMRNLKNSELKFFNELSDYKSFMEFFRNLNKNL